MSPITCFARFTAIGLLVLGLGSVSLGSKAQANSNAHLRGSYAFTTKRTCTVASLPFLGPSFDIPVGTTFLVRQASVDSGITTYYDDGTATSSGRSSTMNLTASTGAIYSLTDFMSNHTYSVDRDGIVSTTTVLTTFHTILGSGAGNTGTVTGQIGRGQIVGKTIVSAPQEQIVNETLNFTPPVGAPFTQHRICNRSTISEKLSDS